MIPVISYKDLAIVYHLAQLGQDVGRRLSALEAYCWVGMFVPDEILHLLCMKGVGFTVDRIQPAHGSPLVAQGSSVPIRVNLVRSILQVLSFPWQFFLWRKCIESWRSAVQAHQAIVVVALKQDVPLAKLLISDRPRNHVLVVLSDWVALKSPATLAWLRESEIDHIVLPRDVAVSDLHRIFESESRKVMAIAESSLIDHSFSHQVQKAAVNCGHDTATVQHGFENVGLTYKSSLDSSAEGVTFASSRVFVWQPLDRLPAWVPAETRDKCVYVGPIKHPIDQREHMPSLPALRLFEKVVGVFENLHWERYSEEFRTNFFQLVSALAASYPNVCFLVRPHPAGQWSSVHWTGALPENVIIAHSSEPPWDAMEVTEFLALCSATLTTPSTVAVDAVLVGCPAVVYAGTLEADVYGFAELAVGYTDVKNFLDRLSEPMADADVAELQWGRLLSYFGGIPSGVDTVRQWLQR